jgi:hypothetical protein
MLVLVLQHHPDGPLPQLLGVPPRSGHGSIHHSQIGASKEPGAVHWRGLAAAGCAGSVSTRAAFGLVVVLGRRRRAPEARMTTEVIVCASPAKPPWEVASERPSS